MNLQNGVLTFVHINFKKKFCALFLVHVRRTSYSIIHIVFVFYFLNLNQSKSKEPEAV